MGRISTSASYSVSEKRPSLTADTVLQGRYRVTRRLGKGGMGAVYEAIDLRLDVTVAIKEAFSTDARLRKQFEHEARLLAQLHHSALPRVTDYFAEGERVFLVMQFIAGDDLGEIIAKQPGPLPRNTVIAWADQLLDALIYVHTRERQIIHRDIKPHNLKLTTAGTIALLDFGLAKTDSDTTTLNSSSSVFGFTRRYSPPEQMQDEGTTPQSDIYALGATLYHLLTGVKPPDALERARAIAKSEEDPLRPANEIHSAVGPEVSAMLLRAMELDPGRRYKDANEFREALRRVGRSETRAVSDWRDRGLSDSTGPPNVNVTVVNKPAAIDPFDSYSILKPAEIDWLLPKPSRRPFVVVGLIGMLLVGAVLAFSNTDGWTNLSKAAVDYIQPSRDLTNANSTAQEKSGRAQTSNQLNTARSAGAGKPIPREQRVRKSQVEAGTKQNRKSHAR
ncbi:MAG TPA: serine/threonine-protein kinase [Pyrinomonadaceae bacterium]|nr:serine/threonine-protein kinase [Pyrinomonadaceae bacterium]